MIVLLLGTHLFMTVRTGFIQRKTLTGIRLSLTKDPDSPGDVSQFQALTTALASTIGTGNIVGVGTAVFLGGPVLSLDLAWTVANILNALMAVPNLIAVLLLSGVIARETRHYLNHLDEKDEAEIPVVDR